MQKADNKNLWIQETTILPLVTSTDDMRVLIRTPIVIERKVVELTGQQVADLQAKNIDVIIPPAV